RTAVECCAAGASTPEVGGYWIPASAGMTAVVGDGGTEGRTPRSRDSRGAHGNAAKSSCSSLAFYGGRCENTPPLAQSALEAAGQTSARLCSCRDTRRFPWPSERWFGARTFTSMSTKWWVTT